MSGVKASSFPKYVSGLAHLRQGDKVDSAEQQAKPKLVKPVHEKEKQSKSEPIIEYHKQLLGHPNLVVTRSTAKARDGTSVKLP